MNIQSIDTTSRRDFHVVPTGNFWRVIQEGNPLPLTIVPTKIEAMGYGIEQARMGRVSVVIHGTNGQIQNVWSYDVRRGASELD